MTLVTDAFINEYAWMGWWMLYSLLAVPVLMFLGWLLSLSRKTDVIGLICFLLVYPAIAVFLFSLLGVYFTQGTNVGALEKDITELGFKDVNWTEIDNKFNATLDGEPVDCALFDTEDETKFKVVCVDIEPS